MINIIDEKFSKYYAVDEHGDVFSLHNKKPRKLKPSLGKNGYMHVSLSKGYDMRRATVHRLVANIFIPNAENKPEVNHIDGDKTNNDPMNLEWNTKSENRMHSINKLGEKSNFSRKEVSEKAARNMKLTKATMSQDEASELAEMIDRTGISIREASRLSGISRGTIGNLMRHGNIAVTE